MATHGNRRTSSRKKEETLVSVTTNASPDPICRFCHRPVLIDPVSPSEPDQHVTFRQGLAHRRCALAAVPGSSTAGQSEERADGTDRRTGVASGIAGPRSGPTVRLGGG
jgi:hypothetical protein